ncbi:hypothetical protein BB559_007381 [Furculomyces boomerangus]|uniref:Microsomal glutathione S-transferase 3 n=2 Tax=Harpellales TaxID=61421 RepID=A0A2T9XXJ9_9FUNG|nr:hypothetical protein BB559_007381 [Furculomyces boomerangus]PVZ98774.1 hypothetical protein BB558_005219 [Smittium angustum]
MITIEANYAWNIIIAAGMGIQCTIAGINCGSVRRKFNVPHPDMGCGRFAAKLSDKDWATFNNVIRVHQNYVEQLPIAISAVLMCGLFYGKVSATLGLIYIASRFAYAYGYSTFGPKGRMVGAVSQYLSITSMLFLCIFGSYKQLSK